MLSFSHVSGKHERIDCGHALTFPSSSPPKRLPRSDFSPPSPPHDFNYPSSFLWPRDDSFLKLLHYRQRPSHASICSPLFFRCLILDKHSLSSLRLEEMPIRENSELVFFFAPLFHSSVLLSGEVFHLAPVVDPKK